MSKNLIDNQNYGMTEGLPITYDDAVSLWSGSADVGDTIALSEAFTNFKQLMFVNGSRRCAVILVGNEAVSSSWDEYPNSSLAVGKWFQMLMSGTSFSVTNDQPNYLSFQNDLYAMSAVSATSIEYLKTRSIYASAQNEAAAPGEVVWNTRPDSSNILAVYGIGRIANN